MFKTDVYIPSLIELLRVAYQERLLYVGLQGSYLRDEATNHSDIDIMVVISDIGVDDLAEYRKAISLGDGNEFDFDEAFALLFIWCKETMVKI